jgi:hypothetical protein
MVGLLGLVIQRSADMGSTSVGKHEGSQNCYKPHHDSRPNRFTVAFGMV